MGKQQIIEAMQDLPVDMRARLADEILQTLNPVDPEVEKAWATEASRRLKAFEDGEVETIPGEQVIKELKNITEE